VKRIERTLECHHHHHHHHHRVSGVRDLKFTTTTTTAARANRPTVGRRARGWTSASAHVVFPSTCIIYRTRVRSERFPALRHATVHACLDASQRTYVKKGSRVPRVATSGRGRLNIDTDDDDDDDARARAWTPRSPKQPSRLRVARPTTARGAGGKPLRTEKTRCGGETKYLM